MNAIIIGSSGGYPYVSYIGNAQGKAKEIQKAYQHCVDCMMEEHEKEDTVTEITVTEITVIYNGKIHEFLPDKQLIEFFKTI